MRLLKETELTKRPKQHDLPKTRRKECGIGRLRRRTERNRLGESRGGFAYAKNHVLRQSQDGIFQIL